MPNNGCEKNGQRIVSDWNVLFSSVLYIIFEFCFPDEDSYFLMINFAGMCFLFVPTNLMFGCKVACSFSVAIHHLMTFYGYF